MTDVFGQHIPGFVSVRRTDSGTEIIYFRNLESAMEYAKKWPGVSPRKSNREETKGLWYLGFPE